MRSISRSLRVRLLRLSVEQSLVSEVSGLEKNTMKLMNFVLKIMYRYVTIKWKKRIGVLIGELERPAER